MLPATRPISLRCAIQRYALVLAGRRPYNVESQKYNGLRGGGLSAWTVKSGDYVAGGVAIVFADGIVNVDG